jgi:hypothetical protein
MQSYDGDLIEALRAKQRELRESDVRFAARLGIHRETWRLIRQGQRGVSLRTLRSATAAFPDLAREAIDITVPRNASKPTD